MRIETHYIDYQGDILSLNDYKSKHWRVLKKRYDKIKTSMAWQIKAARLPKFKWIELEVEFNTRHDMDNISGTIKPFVDQLTVSGRITNDTRKQWDRLCIRANKELKKGTVRFTIIGEIQ